MIWHLSWHFLSNFAGLHLKTARAKFHQSHCTILTTSLELTNRRARNCYTLIIRDSRPRPGNNKQNFLASWLVNLGHVIFTLFISLSFRLFTSKSDRRQIWPIALHHIDHVTWSKSEKLIHRYTSDLSTRPRKNTTFSLIDCSIFFTWPIVLYDWSRLVLVLFLLIIHTKIKSIFSTGLPSLSFSFTFSPCNLFLLFHNEPLRSLLLIGSLRRLLYWW